MDVYTLQRQAYRPKIYEQHRRMNKTPAEWRLEHKDFLNGELPVLYSPQKSVKTDATDGYEARVIHHPVINPVLQEIKPAKLRRVQPKEPPREFKQPEPTQEFEQPAPFTPPEMTEIQKFREEGRIERAREKCKEANAWRNLGVNRNWNKVLDCGFNM